MVKIYLNKNMREKYQIASNVVRKNLSKIKTLPAQS